MKKFLLGNRVLIEGDTGEKKTASGIIIAKTEDMGDYITGIVFLVGEGRRNDHGDLLPMKVEKGDSVIFQYGKPIQIDGKTYLMVMEEDIIYIN